MQSQRSFTAVAGLIFAVLIAVHVVRIVFEGAGLLRDPFFIGINVIALGMASWSALLLFKRPS